MNKKPGTSKDAADKLVKNIRRKTRQTYSAEEKIRIVLAGLRGKARIGVWQQEDALRVPASALFRTGEDWSVFVAEEGVAALRIVRIGRNNGIVAEVQEGLSPSEQVILYPSAAIADGAAVAQRSVE